MTGKKLLFTTMTIDWALVKKQTLWSYEDLIKKLEKVLAYGFVQEHYHHTMKEAGRYVSKVQNGYMQTSDLIRSGPLIASFKKLQAFRIASYGDLVQRVATREKCQVLLDQTDLSFDELISVLNYLFRWVLPFAIPAREFLAVEDAVQAGYLGQLKRHRVCTNLDILERGRIRAGRKELSRVTGVPEPFLLVIIHKADISRLAYVRGKTVNHLCGGGYDTLKKIADADAAKMEKDMAAYYRTLGKSSSDFKAVIPLSWMIGGARILPRVIKG